MIFKNLTAAEELTYREWAKENYTRLEPISGCWHPVVQEECAAMNAELKEVTG